MGTINPQWSWGLNPLPFGIETNWPDETCPTFGTAPLPPQTDALEPSRSKIAMVNIRPTGKKF